MHFRLMTAREISKKMLSLLAAFFGNFNYLLALLPAIRKMARP